MSKWYVLIAAIVFSVVTLWFPYVSYFQSRGHYQYFPLLLAAVGIILWSRRAEVFEKPTTPSALFAIGGLLGTSLIALAGHLTFSGFAGITASISAISVLIYAAFGWSGFRKSMAVLWLLIFAIPLPFGLDQSLILNMQFFASRLASYILDGIGFMHFREGVILITENSQFLTEEACSGIRSLFSSMAVVGVYGVALRHCWYRIIINLFQTVFWVLVGNALRVAVVVVLADRVDPWYATGIGHDGIGLLVFAFILAMVVSTDAFLSLFLRYQSTDEDEVVVNLAVSMPSYPLRPGLSYCLVGWLLLVGLAGSRVAYVAYGDLNRVEISDAPAPDVEDLPVNLAGWERRSFEHVERDGNALHASNSYVWTYVRGQSAIVVSVDCPWGEWHNLYPCYRGLGWNVEPTYFIDDKSMPNIASRETHSELKMEKNGRYGYVMFAVVDQAGIEVFPSSSMAFQKWSRLPTAILQEATESLGLAPETQFAIGGLKLPATTIQVLIESSEPLNEEQLNEMRKLYVDVRGRLLAGKRWQ